MDSFLNILLPVMVGAFTGYITNIYAINMLFKEYTPLKIGGVIKKTKNEFIENISELVERDIINHKTLGNELSKIEFKDNMEELINDLLKVSLYENIGDVKFNEIDGFDETLSNTKMFIDKKLSAHTRNIIEVFFEKTFIDEVLSKKQIQHVIKNISDELLKALKSEDFLKSLINDFISEQGNKKVSDFVSEEALRKLKNNILEQIENGFEKIKNNEDIRLDDGLEELLDSIDYQSIITEFEKSIFSKPLINIVSTENQEILINKFKYNMKIFLKSDEVDKLFVSLIQDLINLGRKIDRPILDLISPKFKPSVKDYLKNKLPIFIEKICIWIKDNSGDIEELIQEAINETLDNSRGFRGELLTLIKESFLGEIASKNDVADKIVDFLEDKLDIEELSELLTQKVIDYLEEKTIQSMIASLEKNNLVSPEKISNSLIDSILMYVDLLPEEKYKKFFDQKLEKYISFDFSRYFEENLKAKAINYLKNSIILKDSLKDDIIAKFEHKYNEVIHSSFKEILDNEKINLASEASQNKILDKLILQKENISDYVTKKITYLVEGMTFDRVVTKDQRNNAFKILNKKVSEGISNYVESTKTKEIKSILNILNRNKRIDQILADLAIEFTNNNLEFLIKGNIKKTVSKNLHKLNDEEIVSLVHEFMGRELKPITYFGALLGGIFGIIPVLLNEGYIVADFNFNAVNLGVFALVGILTNVIALEMIFKPYKKNKILAKIPFLTNFSQGYIVKNRESFGKNLANFVDTSLMDKELIDSNFKKNYSKIKSSLLEGISKNNYAKIADVLECYEEEISEKISTFTLRYLEDNKKNLTLQLVNLTKELELKEIPVDNLIDFVDKYILNNKEFLKEKLNNEINSFIDSDMEVNTLIGEKGSLYIKETIGKETGKQIDKSLYYINHKDSINKLIDDYEAKYDKIMSKSITESFDENFIGNIQNQLLSFIEKTILSPNAKNKILDFINQKFNEELSKEKRVEDLLDGEIKNQIEKNLDKMLQGVENILIKSLKENEEQIQDETKKFILGKLNFIQKSGYRFLGGDSIVDEIILKLINVKFPKYISDSEQEIKSLLDDLLKEHIYSAKISDIKLKVSDSHVSSVIEDFLDNKENLKVLNTFIGKISNSVMAELISIPMSRYLNIVNLTKLKDVYSRFEPEIHDLIDLTEKEVIKSKDQIEIKSASLIYDLGYRNILDIKVNEVFKDINLEDIDLFVDRGFDEAINSEGLKKNLSYMIKHIYINGYEHKKVKDIINEDILYSDLDKKIEQLLGNNEARTLINEIIRDIVVSIKEDNASFIDAKTKDQGIDIALNSILQSGSRNVSSILKDIDFKNITENKIEELNPREIHELFNSFAGKYFTRLKIYGLGGGVFGLHFFIVILAFIIHLIEQYNERS